MKKSLLSIALLSSLATGYASAEEPSFNYVEGGYSDIEESDGFIVRGSFELNENIYITGSYNDVTDDEFDTDIDLSLTTLGVGYKTLLSDTTALYAEINYIDAEVDTDFGSASEDGHKAAIGVRSMVTDSTEIYSEIANANRLDFTETILTVGAKQYFTDNIGLFAEYSRNDFETDAYNVGVSFKF